ncbi:2-oxo-4-hydroxy-4-carboxy-5-ureidoimidazoline decarboxylase [Streptomyces sp. NPDC012623]|uniref:2-oxo-4-hydroxy-4-carboxy-5-ureidoimidazoline decarboxylase n=1 Tax=unclassified Streptomyces TaxID=2593676 RepID=UPI0036D0AF2B
MVTSFPTSSFFSPDRTLHATVTPVRTSAPTPPSPVSPEPPRFRPPQSAFEEPPLSRAPTAGPPHGLRRFNTAPRTVIEPALLACLGSGRWARRIAAHRPYPDPDSLLAASDEAGYDLSFSDLAEALAAESPAAPPPGAPAAATTALRAAHAAYESRFGHAFVIGPAGLRPEESLDHILAAIRTRLGHDPDHERSVSADELRRLARSRLTRLIQDPPRLVGRQPGPGADFPGCPGSPSVAV